MKRLKALFIVIMGVLLVLTSVLSYVGNTAVVAEKQREIYFTGVAASVGRYAQQIEVKLKNGRTLEHFFGLKNILQEASNCNSYIEGVCVLDKEYRVISEIRDRPDDSNMFRRAALYTNDDAGKSFIRYYDKEYSKHILTFPLYGSGSAPEGFMILQIDDVAVRNQSSEYLRQSRIINENIFAVAFLSGIAAFIHLCRRKEHIYRSSAIVVGSTVCGSVFVSGAIETLRLFVWINDTVHRASASIVAALQDVVLNIIGKGVDMGKIFDLNNWLIESCDKISFIDMLLCDKYYRLSPVISTSFINENVLPVILNVLAIFAACCAVCAVFIVMGALTDRSKVRRDVSNDEKNREEVL